MTRTMTFQPTEQQQAFIDKLIQVGDYKNQSEVIRAALRLPEDQRAASKIELLLSLIDEGYESGEAENWSPAKFKARMKTKHAL